MKWLIIERKLLPYFKEDTLGGKLILLVFARQKPITFALLEEGYFSSFVFIVRLEQFVMNGRS